MQKIKALYQKHREIALYIFFGGLTAVVNFVVYEGLEWVLLPRWGGHSYLASRPVAFVAAVSFAFIVNKLYVFEQKSWEAHRVARELLTFLAARVASFALEYGLQIAAFDLLWPKAEPWFTQLWQERLHMPFTPFKAYRFIVLWCMIVVLVTFLNYFFSKWVVFRKKEDGRAEE